VADSSTPRETISPECRIILGVKGDFAAARRWLLVVCHFVGPLIFFTNVTRNPYTTQIALVHALLAASLAAWALSEARRKDAWRWPRLPVALPLALFALAWTLSWVRAWLVAPVFFRPSIESQGATAFLFQGAVCLAAFLLSASASAEDDGTADVPLGAWAGFALGWGLLWAFYPQAQSRPYGPPESFAPLVWDPYGALVWALGLAGVLRLTRRGRVADFLHLALCVGFLASAYGVLQYFNMDFIWPHVLNPYGGRAVSTFGNPNFVSSYDVALMPIALALFLVERSLARRAAYAVVFLTLEGAMLATLTRSSWGGAAAACAALMLFPSLRARLRGDARAAGVLFGAAAALVAFWPSSAIASSYTPTVVDRLTEISTILKRDGSYSPWHQRVLIWASAWLMGSESPLLGKGGGLFELFYPFYQGTMLHAYPFFHNMRTHANNAHNEILEAFAQTGLLGLGAFLAFWAAFFESVRRWARGRAGADPLWAGAAAGCAGVLIDNLMNVSLHFTVPALLFWWLAGTVMGRGSREGGGLAAWTAPRGARLAAAGALALAAAGVAWTEVRVWNREAWFFAGFKHDRATDLPGSVRDLEASRAWGPREVNALYELGNAYARSSRPVDAAAAYREALKANAGYDEIFANLATLDATVLADPAEARGFFEVAWAINPLAGNLANALTTIYLRDPDKDGDAALDVLRQAARDFPDNADDWNNLGFVLARRRDWDEAERAFTRALEIAPDLATAERNLTGLAAQSRRPPAPILGVLRDLHALDAAIARRDSSDATLALAASIARREPAILKGRFLYGSLLLARARPAEAVPELEFVAARMPGKAAVRLNLGASYRALGRLAEAQAEFQAALSAEPNNAQVRDQLRALGVLR
jgi:tetratricopeptide (TPR) repeat protein